MLLYFDVDRLKQVNDSRGHDAGDHYLVKLAAELTAVVRSEDVVARLGGDEFAVLMRNVAPADAERLGDIVRTRLSATVSVGVALVDGKNSATDVLAVADAACYAAKAQGGNRTEFFTSP